MCSLMSACDVRSTMKLGKVSSMTRGGKERTPFKGICWVLLAMMPSIFIVANPAPHDRKCMPHNVTAVPTNAT